ncbi:acetyl-CoA carboxylase biotin carboxylase subunit [candidate division KSB1 bacterium 4484_87]|nr:MAG: acetyl-CoA carboxylase biotin carboxylase subunit [candidate division KSB1 bacterium 4484_87]
MIKKILIANRGEIAVRIMRTCREMGIHSVAVYSEADQTARHVVYADEAYLLGPAPANESYLVIDKIIEIAKKSGADAIHPGYGFLAENPIFAQRVEENGLIFIGPKPKTIALLGDKMAARQIMEKANVPIVPGMKEPISSTQEALQFAQEVGFPILLKAAAGGGGKGMRVVRQESEIEEMFLRAQSEAQSAFGDKRIYLEKYLEKPRHIEIQILADRYGNVIHLGERECSIQRRHQKVIEESPSPIVDEALRNKMGQTAVTAAKASGYVNAGTVEFLLDQDNNFYFLEVNTRLQVEHPVTELITGLDLVREQILIAAGEKLSLGQEDIQFHGHAIECRIYAEDPDNEFMPSVGTIFNYREPGGPGVRVDSGFSRGDTVPIYYDPIIAKLITWGQNRDQAISRMKRALDEYVIHGIQTIIPFHRRLFELKDFVTGNLSTHFIQEHFDQSNELERFSEEELQALAALVCAVDYSEKKRASGFISQKPIQNWKMIQRYCQLINR